MISISRTAVKDAQLLSEIAIRSFIQSHGHSADTGTINNYVTERYNPEALRKESEDDRNIFHIISHEGQPAGYSKIILNNPYESSAEKNITKLERIYVLQEFYDKKLGKELFHFNKELAKANGQSGMWLFVWIENHRAIRFYEQNGFVIIGSYDFQLSETHSNPNHQLFLQL